MGRTPGGTSGSGARGTLRGTPAGLLLAVSVAWAAAVTGCVQTTTPAPPRGPVEVKLKERFRVFAGDEHVGYLIYSEIAGERYFRVVTPIGSWVGDIYRNMQFAKCEPFRDRPRNLGMFKMKEGLALLFETDRPIRVLPLEGRGAATEAAAHRLFLRALNDDR